MKLYAMDGIYYRYSEASDCEEGNTLVCECVALVDCGLEYDIDVPL